MKKIFYLTTLFMIFFALQISSVEAIPAHPAFTDDVFFQAIIDTLNAGILGKTDRNISYRPTDEELNLITSLTIDTNYIIEHGHIYNLDGIEKLQGLQKLVIQSMPEVESINLEYNSQLKTVDIKYFHQLSNIKFPQNCKIDKLVLINTNLNVLDLRRCTELTELEVSNNFVEPSLDKSVIADNSVLISNFYQATLDYLDISTCTKIRSLQLGSITFPTLDVSHCYNLQYVPLSGKSLKKLILPPNACVRQLYIDGTGINSFDDITNLDKHYTIFDCRFNKYCILDGEKFDKANLVRLHYDTNGTIPYVVYNTSGTIDIPRAMQLITEGKLGGMLSPTYYRNGEWGEATVKYKDMTISTTGTVSASIKNGKIAYSNATYGDTITIQCPYGTEDSNDGFWIAAKYTIIPQNQYIEDKSFAKKIYDTLSSYGIKSSPTLDDLKKVTSLEITEEDNIKSLKGIEYLTGLRHLTICNMDISKLDLSPYSELTSLTLKNLDNLKTLDFSKNPLLENITIRGVYLEEADFSECSNLINLELNSYVPEKAVLKKFDVSNCTKLESLILVGCKAKEVDLRNCVNIQGILIDDEAIQKEILPKSLEPFIVKLDSPFVSNNPSEFAEPSIPIVTPTPMPTIDDISYPIYRKSPVSTFMEKLLSAISFFF